MMKQPFLRKSLRKKNSPPTEGLKLQLCCGKDLKQGWVNVDYGNFGQEVKADLNKRWGFAKDNSVDYIYCKDGLEHLESAVHFLSECGRILKKGGIAEIIVPHFKNPSAYHITHHQWFSWRGFQRYPLPTEKSDLKLIQNKLIIEDNIPPLNWLANISPVWWEKFFYVCGLHLKFRKS